MVSGNEAKQRPGVHVTLAMLVAPIETLVNTALMTANIIYTADSLCTWRGKKQYTGAMGTRQSCELTNKHGWLYAGIGILRRKQRLGSVACTVVDR